MRQQEEDSDAAGQGSPCLDVGGAQGWERDSRHYRLSRLNWTYFEGRETRLTQGQRQASAYPCRRSRDAAVEEAAAGQGHHRVLERRTRAEAASQKVFAGHHGIRATWSGRETAGRTAGGGRGSCGEAGRSEWASKGEHVDVAGIGVERQDAQRAAVVEVVAVELAIEKAEISWRLAHHQEQSPRSAST